MALLKNNLENEIRSLLPSASAASLAHGYASAKKRYAKKSIAFLYYVLFIAPLVGISIYFITTMHPDTITLSGFISRFLIMSPLLGVSSFGALSIHRNRKLFEEYNHKEKVMELFHGFERLVGDGRNQDQMNTLVGIMLKTVENNPCSSTSKYEKEGNPLTQIMQRQLGVSNDGVEEVVTHHPSSEQQ